LNGDEDKSGDLTWVPPELRALGLIKPFKATEDDKKKEEEQTRDKFDESGRDNVRRSKAPEKTDIEKQVGLA